MDDEGIGARAFVPGHITGLFSIHRTDEPATTGSRGAGITLSDGVTVQVTPAQETTVSLDGNGTSIDAVTEVLDSLDVTAEVAGTTELPVGSGFGVSGAMALGTALAANQAFETGLSENELIRLAHVAEVEAGTGLGDVVAQARGGIPLRLEPGAPPHGTMDGIPAVTDIEYLDFGTLSTPDVLAERPERITNAGTDALANLRERPTLDRFMAMSLQFAEDVGLLTDDLQIVIDDVEDAGGMASMAMLGKTVFATGTGLSAAGYEPQQTSVHPAGATLLQD